ncbi:TadE family type IV pilus minor pilin [Actinomycetospora chiangmaiensis]|uniref:TadE family type IV pilus minor pilin n=1 Tax=Actinomycetospora chiangmaiensis TaxID=402650 RepID=UPI00036F5C4D|nr:TadE family type IV pilus minor pilin [Actinomycetospora chiangmaiensis]
MATVEAAIALGALVLVFAVVLAGLGAVVARIRCVDAAGDGARRAARDDAVAARDLAVGLPAGTEVTVTVEGDTVRVRVAVPPLGGALRGLHVTAEAVAAREPSVAGPTGAPDGAATDEGAADRGAVDGRAPDGSATDGSALHGAAPAGAASDGGAVGGSPAGDPADTARRPAPPAAVPQELPP